MRLANAQADNVAPPASRSESSDSLSRLRTLLAELVTERVVYIDTLRVMLARPLTEPERYRLIVAQGRTVKKARRAKLQKPHPWWTHTLQLDQPTWEVIAELQRFGIVHKVNRIDVALDLLTGSRLDGERLRSRLRRHLIIRRGREQIIFIDSSTTDYYARKTSSRGLKVYADKASKMVPRSACCHVEIWNKTPTVVERAGLVTLDTITPESVDNMLRRQLRVYWLANPFALRRAAEARIKEDAAERAGGDLLVTREHERAARKDLGRKLFGITWSDDLMQGTRWHYGFLQNIALNFRDVAEIIEGDNALLFA